MKLIELQSRIGAAETLLKAMASEPRLMLLCELSQGERTVTELQQALGIAMSAVSQHLAKLRGAGLVATRRESQTIHYSLASDAAREILGSLHGIFCRAAKPKSSKRRNVS